MDQQCESLDVYIHQWMGELEQVDDMMVIGIKI